MAAAALFAAGDAGAAPVSPTNPLVPAQGFGVVVAGDATLSGTENEGTVAIGGDLTLGGPYNVAATTAGSFVDDGDQQPTALLVGGRVNFADSAPDAVLRVLDNGYVKIGDLTGATVRDTDDNGALRNTRVLPTADYDATPRIELTIRQPVDSVGPTTPFDFAAAFDSFRTTSTELATCPDTVTLRDSEGNPLPSPIPPGSSAHITLTPGMTNVLNIDAADLANITTLTFDDQPTADTPLLINVDTSGVGNTFSWLPPTTAGISGQQAPYILWNFPTAQVVELVPGGPTVEGAIYAPNADVRDNSDSNTEGSIVAAQYEHNGGEVHYFPFDALLSCPGTSPSPSESPTPSPSESPTPSASPTPSPSESPTPSASPTPSPSESPTPSAPPTSPPVPPPSSSHPSLPVTGTDLTGYLGTGAGLLVAGGGALLWYRRMRDVTGGADRTE